MQTAIESVVSMPILNPATGCASKTFVFFGVIDKFGGGKIVDYKSTDDPARFIHQQCVGLQPELYALALLARGVTITEIEFRLVRKMQLKYSRPSFKWAVMKAGRKSAVKVCDDQGEAKKLAVLQGGTVVERVTGDKTRDVYEDRCLEWIAQEHSRVVEHTHFLTQARLDQAKHLLWESTKRILDNRKTGRWLANQYACFAYNKDCEFCELCACEMNGGDVRWVIEDQYEVVEDTHPELGGATHDKDILTYSSTCKLALCEVYYLRRYEQKLRRRRQGDSESLWLGSAMHRGLEAYGKSGEAAAFSAIDAWADEHPIIGEDQAWFQDQQIAKARAMVRAAALKWSMDQDGDTVETSDG